MGYNYAMVKLARNIIAYKGIKKYINVIYIFTRWRGCHLDDLLQEQAALFALSMWANPRAGPCTQ